MPPFGSRAAERRKLRGPFGAPYLAPALLAAGAVALGWWLLARAPQVTAALQPPDVQVRRALALMTRARLDDVYGHAAGGTASLEPVRFSDVTVELSDGPDGPQARVTAMVEADGEVAWRDELARLGYVGRERFGMRPCRAAGWCADGRQFDGLRAVLRLLFRRQDALQAADAPAWARLVGAGYRGAGGREALVARVGRDLASGPPLRLRPRAWQIRVDRDEALVGEDAEVSAGGGAAVAQRARFTLAREGERWVFVDGL